MTVFLCTSNPAPCVNTTSMTPLPRGGLAGSLAVKSRRGVLHCPWAAGDHPGCLEVSGSNDSTGSRHQTKARPRGQLRWTHAIPLAAPGVAPDHFHASECPRGHDHYSGNKVVMQPRPQRVPPAVYNGNTGRHADGADATATRPGCGGPFGARPALTATTAAAARARSTGGEATPGLERHQRARPRGRRQPFFNASTAIVPARMTVSRANAHIASVICRYQAVQLRTSY